MPRITDPARTGGRSLQLAALRRDFRDGTLTVGALVEGLLEAQARWADSALWIARLDADELRRRAADLDRHRAADPAVLDRLPLFGVPFAVKDNIDAAGLPTTAGCPAFAYRPAASAPVVEALIRAGALLIGKTNLDQFATGLVGTRSPYGVPRNPFDDRYIPGGSSSGSAVAVAAGLVGFALGTDTAGSGRVPAAFNNIVGLKPTRGLVSGRGVVPACRSLDCVSIFALTVADALAVLDVAAGFDPADPYARVAPGGVIEVGDGAFRFGTPDEEALEFFGDGEYARLFAAAVETMRDLGGVAVPVPLAPFHEAAELLYDGPWLAERLAATEALLAAAPEALLPVTRAIIEGGRRFSALDAFRAEERLLALRRTGAAVFGAIDVLLLPTAGTIFTREAVAAEPLRRNAELGHYTNFVNLLDLAAIAVPAGLRADGMPFGISLIGPAFADRQLAALAARFEQHLDLPLGATGAQREAPPRAAPRPVAGRIPLAVVGAHMSGMALNIELLRLGARLLGPARTEACYRLFALPGAPPRPGLLRVAAGAGAAIEAEIWSLDPGAFGAFVAAVPAPLSIGTLRLADGATVKGFLCEAAATDGARDISGMGGWRAFVAGQLADQSRSSR